MVLTLHRKREVILHTAFWIVYASFIINHISSYQPGPQIHWGRVLLAALISASYLLILSYVNYFYLIPRLLLRKKIGRFVLVFIAFFATMILARLAVETLALGRSWEIQSPARTTIMIQSTISDLFIVLFIGLLRFAFDWLKLDTHHRQLETEKLNTEIKFLKAQVNPHFLFNTLNNLYYLSTIKSDTAPLVISKLSEVMRYMIYDSNHEQIELAREIEYMQHYIGLERLRLRDGVPLEFEIAGRTDILISPLILIPFLENAFKHGVSNANDHCWIKARLEVNEQQLIYTIANSKIKTIASPSEEDGIGLKNSKRRLDLTYPGKHRLDIQDAKDSFLVTLIIERT